MKICPGDYLVSGTFCDAKQAAQTLASSTFSISTADSLAVYALNNMYHIVQKCKYIINIYIEWQLAAMQNAEHVYHTIFYCVIIFWSVRHF